MEVVLANPAGCHPHAEILIEARAVAEKRGGSVDVVADPNTAVRGAQVVYTHVWLSICEEAERTQRLATLQGYQVTPDLMHRRPRTRSSCIACRPTAVWRWRPR